MEHLPDYYAVLGVDVNAPPDVLKKAFKHLALQYHPDVYKGEDAEEKTREILLAYKTLTDSEHRRVYDLSRSKQGPSNSTPTEKTPNEFSAAHSDQQRAFIFPLLNDGAPAQIDLGEIIYLLSASEIRRLKERGMLRGAKIASMTETYFYHRCTHQWQVASLPAFCPQCQARDWREYLLLRCNTVRPFSRVNKSAMRLVRSTTEMVRFAHPTSCSPYLLLVEKRSGVPLRKSDCGMYETG